MRYSGIFLGGKVGILSPLKMVLPPELCLNDKIDFNMIKVLPPSIFKKWFAHPEFIF